MKVQILIGLPASGKSSYAKEFCEKNNDWVRINRDDLRNMRGKYWLPIHEEMITEWELSTIELALAHNNNVIVDSTNLNLKYRSRMVKFIEHQFPGIEITTKVFDVSPEECIKRDLKRPNSVGAEVIWGMYYKYIAPIPTYAEDPSLPHCIICDIDGTLAHNTSGRSPFDWKRVGEDSVDPAIDLLVGVYQDAGLHVVYMSGRDESCRPETLDWLKKVCGSGPLYMRPAGDNRKDSIIKKELFEKHIRGKYYVDFVLDDRDQVVRMWRNELGLKCLQVAYGNF